MECRLRLSSSKSMRWLELGHGSWDCMFSKNDARRMLGWVPRVREADGAVAVTAARIVGFVEISVS